MKENKNILIAVYGTLRYQFSNFEYYLKNKSEYLGEWTTEEKYVLLVPGIVPYCLNIQDENSCNIIMNVFKISENVLQEIDHLEGYPNSCYQRRKILLNKEINGQVENIKAWCYLIDDQKYNPKYVSKTGDYREEMINRFPDYAFRCGVLDKV